MRLVNVRRICQAFFLILLIWSCLVTTLGDRWFELRGWPVSWLLELDPLVGLATVLTTGSLYKGLIWGTLTLALTALLGRFFCGWICPLGTLQQMVGVWADKGRRKRARAQGRQPHPCLLYTSPSPRDLVGKLVCRLLLEKKFFLMIRRPPRSTLILFRRQRQMCIRDRCHSQAVK